MPKLWLPFSSARSALLQIQGDDHSCIPFYREGTTDKGWATELARCGVDPSRPLEFIISICLGFFFLSIV
jgi:hypothetical protein